jgi:hypothetical protein
MRRSWGRGGGTGERRSDSEDFGHGGCVGGDSHSFGSKMLRARSVIDDTNNSVRLGDQRKLMNKINLRHSRIS